MENPGTKKKQYMYTIFIDHKDTIYIHKDTIYIHKDTIYIHKDTIYIHKTYATFLRSS